LIDAEAAPLRQRAEERLAARLRDEKASTPRKKKKKGASAAANGPAESTRDEARPVAPEALPDGGDDDGAVDAVPAVDADVPRAPKCPSCSTSNDADAVFCKRCGVSLGKPAGAES
jgi:hypothetical protein